METGPERLNYELSEVMELASGSVCTQIPFFDFSVSILSICMNE